MSTFASSAPEIVTLFLTQAKIYWTVKYEKHTTVENVISFFAEKFRESETAFEIRLGHSLRGPEDAIETVLPPDYHIEEFAYLLKKKKSKKGEPRLYLCPNRVDTEDKEDNENGNIRLKGKKTKLHFVAVQSAQTGKQWTVAVDNQCLVLDLLATVAEHLNVDPQTLYFDLTDKRNNKGRWRCSNA